ncbi:MAG: hypothetical protein V4450_15445 [Bacteroidota bacterium]
MKKVFITVLAAIAIGTSAFAGPVSKSIKVNDHFTASFKKASNVSWSATDKFEEVSFEMNNEKINAFYDNEGELIGTMKKFAFDKLPKSAIETITTKYTFPNYQLQDCVEFVNDAKQTNYYVSFDSKDKTVVLEISKTGVVSVFAKNKK